MTDKRITALEELTAHQARTIDELSGELARQWQVIGSLQRKLDTLGERFSTLEEAAISTPESKPPPHW